MRTPQVEPDWNYGIWTGRSVIVKPVDEQINAAAALANPLAWDGDIQHDAKLRFDHEV